MASLACAGLPEQLLLIVSLRLLTSTENAAFTHARSQPVHALAHVVASYIALLGEATVQHAEHSRRTQPTLSDARAALESLGFAPQTIQDWVRECNTGDWANAHNAEGAEELNDMSGLLRKGRHQRSGQLQTFRELSKQEAELLNESDILYSPESPPILLEEPTFNTHEATPPLSESDSEDFDSDEEMMDATKQARRIARMKQREKSKAITAEPMLVSGNVDFPTEEPEEGFDFGWRSFEDVPSHIPAFLPPLPGLERVADEISLDVVLANKDDPANTNTNENSVKQALAKKVHTHQFTGGAHLDPWKHVVAYEKSALMTRDSGMALDEQPLPLLDDTPPAPLNADQLAERSSLTAFFEAHHELAKRRVKTNQSPPKSIQKRRQAASYLSSLKSHGQDSLFGAIKPHGSRISKRSAGWLPYPLRLAPTDPDPTLHPYYPEYTILNTISTPIQSSEALAPLFVPRVRNIYPQLLRGIQASGMLPGTGPLFTRTTRIAPPGPLGPAGESWPYLLAVVDNFDPKDLAKVQEGKGVQFGFDWARRDPTDAELPKSALPSMQPPEPPAPLTIAVPEPATQEIPEPVAPTVVTINGSLPKAFNGVSRSQSPSQHERSPSLHRSTPSISFFSSSAIRKDAPEEGASNSPQAVISSPAPVTSEGPPKPPKLQIRLALRPPSAPVVTIPPNSEIGEVTQSQLVASPLPETPVQVKQEEPPSTPQPTPPAPKISFKFGGR